MGLLVWLSYIAGGVLWIMMCIYFFTRLPSSSHNAYQVGLGPSDYAGKANSAADLLRENCQAYRSSGKPVFALCEMWKKKPRWFILTVWSGSRHEQSHFSAHRLNVTQYKICRTLAKQAFHNPLCVCDVCLYAELAETCFFQHCLINPACGTHPRLEIIHFGCCLRSFLSSSVLHSQPVPIPTFSL